MLPMRRSAGAAEPAMKETTLFEQEIREQPDALARQLRDGRAATEDVAAAILGFAPHSVMIAARAARHRRGHVRGAAARRAHGCHHERA